MRTLFKDKKSLSYFGCVALFIYSIISLIATILCVIGKKKTTASVFAALAGITAAMGGVMAYTLRVFERAEQDVDDYFDDFGDFDDFDDYEDDEDEEPYVIQIDDTVNEDEFKD